VLIICLLMKTNYFYESKFMTMKKLVMLLALVANFAAFGQAKIEFLNDTTIDYGTVTKDSDDGVRVFKFKNTGNAPLIITNVQSTCGCTVPSKPTEPIMPGKTGEIEVKYNMAPGPIRKTITVESNASNYDGGRIPLKIKGDVVVKPEVNVLEKKKSIMAQ
jgi:hypothetical protein